MKEILDNIFKSFKNGKQGFSSRKLTAFIIIVLAIIIHIKWLTLGNLSQLEMVLTIDYSFIAALFGLTTYSSLNNNKKDKKNGDNDSTETPEN